MVCSKTWRQISKICYPSNCNVHKSMACCDERCVRSSTCSQVQFVGGWKAFAAFNGLLENDLLIFSLTAISEFEVYVLRSTESPAGFTGGHTNLSG